MYHRIADLEHLTGDNFLQAFAAIPAGVTTLDLSYE